MKNRTFISFCINLLIGILFSFPVFSYQNNVNTSLSDCEILSTGHSYENSVINDGSENLIPQSKIVKHSHTRIIKRNYFAGDKDNTKENFCSPCFIELVFENNTSVAQKHYPFFVNLSYLKELRTTRMLC
ncbi:MAG: hypothetical protein ABI462_01605 [Ignavibacteria bacterium]